MHEAGRSVYSLFNVQSNPVWLDCTGAARRLITPSSVQVATSGHENATSHSRMQGFAKHCVLLGRAYCACKILPANDMKARVERHGDLQMLIASGQNATELIGPDILAARDMVGL